MGTFFGKVVDHREAPTDKLDQCVGNVDPADDSEKPKEETARAGIPKGMCRDFLNGLCKRGARCRFDHPDARRTASSLRPACLNFLNGKCKLTLWQCKFRHISEAEHEKEKAAKAAYRAQHGNH